MQSVQSVIYKNQKLIIKTYNLFTTPSINWMRLNVGNVIHMRVT